MGGYTKSCEYYYRGENVYGQKYTLYPQLNYPYTLTSVRQKYTLSIQIKCMDTTFTNGGSIRFHVKITIMDLTKMCGYAIVSSMSKKTGNKPNKRKIADSDLAQGNQWQATKQQQDWLRYYMDPKEKETWGNAYQSAIKAGYSESYASTIMSPSLGLQWVQQAKNIMRLNPEHLKFALAQIISDNMAKDSDKIQAIKLLGTDQGMFVQKQITAHVGLEEALQELE